MSSSLRELRPVAMLLIALFIFMLTTLLFPSIVQGFLVVVLLIGLGIHFSGSSAGPAGMIESSALVTKPPERRFTPPANVATRTRRLQVGDNVQVPAPTYGCPTLNAYNEARRYIAELTTLSDPVDRGDAYGHMRPDGRSLCPIVDRIATGTVSARSSWNGEEFMACVTLVAQNSCVWMDERYLAFKDDSERVATETSSPSAANEPMSAESFLTFGGSAPKKTETMPADFGSVDLPIMAREYEANQARFMRTYRGKSFYATLPIHGVMEDLIERGKYTVSFGSGIFPVAECSVGTPTEIDFIVGKSTGDRLSVWGVIKDRTLGALNLDQCRISD